MKDRLWVPVEAINPAPQNQQKWSHAVKKKKSRIVGWCHCIHPNQNRPTDGRKPDPTGNTEHQKGPGESLRL